MWRRHKKARQPFEAICVIACSTIAEGSGRMVSSTPIRISPPAMPNRPDRNAVATISRPRAAIRIGVIRISAAISASLGQGAQTELSWPGISFPEGGMRRLLFLNGIKAFEAAARSGSFAAAGAEMNVSAAAISRMVHLLEERLGVALFERKANRLVTTAAGRAYQSGLTPIFDALASLTAQVTAPGSVRVLTLGVGPTFAMKWLIPRLADFRKQEPDIEVRITTGGAAAPFGDDWSCGIKLGDGEWPGLVAEPLFAGDLLPVCTPRLAGPLKRHADLKGPSLLRVAHSPDDWPLWLRAAGISRVTARGPEFQFYGQALQAAIDGLGIAMGIRPYIDDDISAGRLIAPFALSVPKGMRWYLVYRNFQTEQRDFAAFRRWIMRAAAGPAGHGRPADKLTGKVHR